MEAHWTAQRNVNSESIMWDGTCTKHGPFTNQQGRCYQCDEENMLAGYEDITITEDE